MNIETKGGEPADERAAFEAWIRTSPGHPYAGQFTTLMWKAWQARAALQSKACASVGVEPVAALLDEFGAAWSKRDRLHAEYLGKAMSDQTYDTFATLRDDTLPALRKRLLAALASPAPFVGEPVTRDTLQIGGRYNWKNQPERLIYMGLCEPRNGRWHQFAKVDVPNVCWCEVTDDDLSSFEATPPATEGASLRTVAEAIEKACPTEVDPDDGAVLVALSAAEVIALREALAAPAAAVPESPADKTRTRSDKS
jgi:hypothetical protein